jgi:hypothetical protein
MKFLVALKDSNGEGRQQASSPHHGHGQTVGETPDDMHVIWPNLSDSVMFAEIFSRV